MTRRERVHRALRHEPTDFIPYQVDFTQQEHERVGAVLRGGGFEGEVGGGHKPSGLGSSGTPSPWSGTRPGWIGISV